MITFDLKDYIVFEDFEVKLITKLIKNRIY